MAAAGIEPAIFRFVAQHLNHCATAVPIYIYSIIYIYIYIVYMSHTALSETGHGQEGYIYIYIYIYIYTHTYFFLIVFLVRPVYKYLSFFWRYRLQMSTATYRSASRLSLDGRKYISVVSNSTSEHNAFFFFLSAFGTELYIALNVQKMRMFWARELRGNSGCNGCGVRCISDNEVLTRER